MSLAVHALHEIGNCCCGQGGRGERNCPSSTKMFRIVMSGICVSGICCEPCNETLGGLAQVAARGEKAARAALASSADADGSEEEDEDADNAYLAERTARLAANKRQLAALGLGGGAGDGARKAARRAAGGSSAEGSGTGSEPGAASVADMPGGVEVPVQHAGARVVDRAPSEQART